MADTIHHWNANRLDLFEISQPTEVLVDFIKIRVEGWRDGLAVKSADRSYRGPGFDPQHPHGG